MKSFIISLASLVLFTACSEKELTKENVLSLLEKSGKYPQTLSFEIYTKDSEDGKKVLAAGLEKEGLVKVERNRRTGDNHAPVIQFTDKASSFLLEPDKGQLSSVQRVKVAEEMLDEISSLEMRDKTLAKITYTTKYTNITPFAKLDKRDFNEKKTYTVMASLTKEGWNLR